MVRRSRLPLPAAVCALILAVLGEYAPARGGEAERSGTAVLEEALTHLGAPAQKTRREAVRRLIQGLPASRPLVLAALPDAPPEVKVSLVEVLARDGSRPAVHALLEELRRTDPLTAARIRRRLVRDPEATRRVLEAWRDAPELRKGEGSGSKVHPRVAELERLLERAEVEGIFLSRKSRTGTTGSYRGQYDVMKPHRPRALELFVGILLDRALPEPGVYPTGTFAFLRPPPIHVDMDELRSMAAHAFSEVARPEDEEALARLVAYLPTLRERMDDLNRFDDIAFLEALGRYSDMVVAVYLVNPDVPVRLGTGLRRARTAAWLLEELLDGLRIHGQWHMWPSPSHRAIVLLRVGRHEDAIAEFLAILRLKDAAPSLAGTYYNLACAYAQWGQELGKTMGQSKFDKALGYLENAVGQQWSDVGWLDEDRDLDPIRDTPRFRTLRARVLEEITPDEGDAR